MAARAFENGNPKRGDALLNEALPLMRGSGSLQLRSSFVHMVAWSAGRRGDWANAARLLAVAAHGRDQLTLVREDAELLAEHNTVSPARAVLGDAEFEALQKEAMALTVEQTLDLAARCLPTAP